MGVSTPEELRLDPRLLVSDLGLWSVPMEARDALPPGVTFYQVVDAHHGYQAAEVELLRQGFGHARSWHYEALGQPQSFLDGEGRLVLRWIRLFRRGERRPDRSVPMIPWRENPGEDDERRRLERAWVEQRDLDVARRLVSIRERVEGPEPARRAGELEYRLPEVELADLARAHAAAGHPVAPWELHASGYTFRRAYDLAAKAQGRYFSAYSYPEGPVDVPTNVCSACKHPKEQHGRRITFRDGSGRISEPAFCTATAERGWGLCLCTRYREPGEERSVWVGALAYDPAMWSSRSAVSVEAGYLPAPRPPTWWSLTATTRTPRSFEGLARQYRITVPMLEALNAEHLARHGRRVQRGDELKIPYPPGEAAYLIATPKHGAGEHGQAGGYMLMPREWTHTRVMRPTGKGRWKNPGDEDVRRLERAWATASSRTPETAARLVAELRRAGRAEAAPIEALALAPLEIAAAEGWAFPEHLAVLAVLGDEEARALSSRYPAQEPAATAIKAAGADIHAYDGRTLPRATGSLTRVLGPFSAVLIANAIVRALWSKTSATYTANRQAAEALLAFQRTWLADPHRYTPRELAREGWRFATFTHVGGGTYMSEMLFSGARLLEAATRDPQGESAATFDPVVYLVHHAWYVLANHLEDAVIRSGLFPGERRVYLAQAGETLMKLMRDALRPWVVAGGPSRWVVE
jgi:hypothetical protein